MPADALAMAPYVAKSSAAIILTMEHKQVQNSLHMDLK